MKKKRSKNDIENDRIIKEICNLYKLDPETIEEDKWYTVKRDDGRTSFWISGQSLKEYILVVIPALEKERLEWERKLWYGEYESK